SLIPRPPLSSPLFPYTTLFRSRGDDLRQRRLEAGTPRSERRGRVELANAEIWRRAGNRSRPIADRHAEHVAERVGRIRARRRARSEEHTSELQSLAYLVCRLLL